MFSIFPWFSHDFPMLFLLKQCFLQHFARAPGQSNSSRSCGTASTRTAMEAFQRRTCGDKKKEKRLGIVGDPSIDAVFSYFFSGGFCQNLSVLLVLAGQTWAAPGRDERCGSRNAGVRLELAMDRSAEWIATWQVEVSKLCEIMSSPHVLQLFVS